MPDMRKKQMTKVSDDIKTRLTIWAQKLKVNVGPWDACDPVAHAILGVIEAQNAVANTIDATCEERDDGTFATDEEVDIAFDARSAAIKKLLAVQIAYSRKEL
jgi:predicted transcriptional regulator